MADQPQDPLANLSQVPQQQGPFNEWLNPSRLRDPLQQHDQVQAGTRTGNIAHYLAKFLEGAAYGKAKKAAMQELQYARDVQSVANLRNTVIGRSDLDPEERSKLLTEIDRTMVSQVPQIIGGGKKKKGEGGAGGDSEQQQHPALNILKSIAEGLTGGPQQKYDPLKKETVSDWYRRLGEMPTVEQRKSQDFNSVNGVIDQITKKNNGKAPTWTEIMSDPRIRSASPVLDKRYGENWKANLQKLYPDPLYGATESQKAKENFEAWKYGHLLPSTSGPSDSTLSTPSGPPQSNQANSPELGEIDQALLQKELGLKPWPRVFIDNPQHTDPKVALQNPYSGEIVDEKTKQPIVGYAKIASPQVDKFSAPKAMKIKALGDKPVMAVVNERTHEVVPVKYSDGSPVLADDTAEIDKIINRNLRISQNMTNASQSAFNSYTRKKEQIDSMAVTKRDLSGNPLDPKQIQALRDSAYKDWQYQDARINVSWNNLNRLAMGSSPIPAPKSNNPADAHNNPLNLRVPGQSTLRFFSTPQEGWDEARSLADSYISGKNRYGIGPDSTLLDFMSTWAPAGDGQNDPEAYADGVAKQLGITASTKLSSLKGRTNELLKAMAPIEGGTQWKALTSPRSEPPPSSTSTTDKKSRTVSVDDFLNIK